MKLLDLSFDSPTDNILLDEVLFYDADRGTAGEILRFWESPRYFVVLGKIGKVEEDVHLETAKAAGVPVLRRSSGGGTVVQGPGCLNYSLILSKERDPAIADLRKSYEYILGRVVSALAAHGVNAEFHPISDIALSGTQRKFSGNAQRRGRNYILHHGTILYNFDLTLISRYLKMPKDIPAYRKDRPHEEFVANLSIPLQVLKTSLAQGFEAQIPVSLQTRQTELLSEFHKTKPTILES